MVWIPVWREIGSQKNTHIYIYIYIVGVWGTRKQAKFRYAPTNKNTIVIHLYCAEVLAHLKS